MSEPPTEPQPETPPAEPAPATEKVEAERHLSEGSQPTSQPGVVTPPPGHAEAAKEPGGIATATSAAAAAGAAAAAAAAHEERLRPKRSGQALFLIVLGVAWGMACLAAIATVAYHNSPASEAAVRKAIAQLPMSAGYLPPGPIQPDTMVDAYMQPEDDYGILIIGKVRLAMKDSERWAWGSYQFNVSPSGSPNFSTNSNNSGPDFDFRIWTEGQVTFAKWNRLSFSFKDGVLRARGKEWPLDGPTVTVFFDGQGKFIEEISGF